MTGNLYDGQDAAHSAICKAWEKLETLHDPSCARSWLFTIGSRCCADLLRRKQQETAEVSRELPGTDEDCADQIIRRQERIELYNRLEAELKRLTPLQRQAVRYCSLLGHSPSELAVREGISSQAASSRLYRGLLALRKALGAAKKDTD